MTGGRPADSTRAVLVVVGLVTSAWSLLALDARATVSARTTADEPQYLLTALSLWEDRSLEITDELADRRYEPFHEVTLPVQTEAVDGTGRHVSPHDPLLPALLAVPMGLGGWAGAKLAMAAMAGLLAALLVWIAIRRFDVEPRTAAIVVAAFALSAPLTAYGAQIYPELPAALVVAAAVAALTGRLEGRGRWLVAAAVVALPWLGIKYAATAAVLALIALGRLVRLGERRAALGLLAALGLAGIAYLLAHRAWYGGWTVYAAGDHFVDGELSVVGTDPDLLARSRRLAGLLLDRGFGLAAWAPAYLLVVPALAALARRRPTGWLVLVAPLAAGWATATWVALTMHGWWWPGRQVVVVLPCLVLAVAWWADMAWAWVRRAVPALGLFGMALWGWLVLEVLDGRRTLIVDFEQTSNPLYRAWRTVLPDYRAATATTWLLQSAWFAALIVLVAAAWRSAGPTSAAALPTSFDPSTQPPTNRRSSHRVPA